MNFYPQFLLVLTCNFQAFNSQFSTLENQKNCHTKFKIFTALYNQKQKECLKFQITKEHHRLINPKKLHIIKPITGNQNLKGHRKTVPALFSPPSPRSNKCSKSGHWIVCFSCQPARTIHFQLFFCCGNFSTNFGHRFPWIFEG